MALGELLLKLQADTAQFQSDMGKASHAAQQHALRIQAAMEQVKRALAGVAVLALATQFKEFVDRTIDGLDRLNDLRTRLGATGQEIIILEGAAKRGGQSIEAISDVASKLSKRLQEASTGTGDAANAFTALGVRVTNADGSLKSVNQILRESGEKLAQYEDGTNKAALATAAFGKGGDRLIPVAEGIADTEKRFKRLGITISEDAITAADKFKDSIEDLKSIQEAQARQLAAQLLPTLQNLIERYIELKAQSHTLEDAGRQLDAGLRLIVWTAMAGVTTFNLLGKSVANFAFFVSEFFEKGPLQANKDAWKRQFELFNDYANGLDIARRAFSDFNKTTNSAGSAPQNRIQAPRIVDLAKAKADADALQKLLDTYSKLALDAIKADGKRAEDMLSLRHQALLVSDREYFATKIDIARSALEAERKVLDEQEKRQRDEVASAPKNTKEHYEATGKLAETLAKRNELEKQFAQLGDTVFYARAAAARNYGVQLEQLNIQLLELRDKTVEAATRKFDASNREFFERAFVNNDQGALAMLNRVRELTVAQAQFNRLKEDYSRIQEELQTGEQRIQNAVRINALGEIEALNRTGALRKQAAADMDAIVQKMRELAEATNDAKLRTAVESLAASVGKLRSESELLADKFNSVLGDAGSGPLADFISGTKSAKDAFNDFTKSLLRNLNEIALKQLSTQFFGPNGSTGVNPGGLLANLFNGGSLFGFAGASGAAGGAATVGVDAFAGAAGSAGGLEGLGAALVGFFDKGTDYVPRTGLAVVHQGERIVPAAQNRAGATGSMVVNNNFYLNAPADRRTQSQIQAAAGMGVQRALARNS